MHLLCNCFCHWFKFCVIATSTWLPSQFIRCYWRSLPNTSQVITNNKASQQWTATIGGFSAHDFNTQSGGALWLPFLDSERRSESIFGIQSAPRFQAIYGVESVPRFQPIFGIQSAPLPLWSYIWCWKRHPLSTHIWHSERPRFQAIYGVESVPRSALRRHLRTAPNGNDKIWIGISHKS